MQQHYVEFLSPGTFMAESSRHPIYDWDVDEAVRLSGEIHERHAARPYGFQFVTRARNDDEMDAREVNRSGVYYLGGEIETLDEIKARGDDRDKTLIFNMEANRWDKVITNTNSWKWTQPFTDDDVVLDQPDWAKSAD